MSSDLPDGSGSPQTPQASEQQKVKAPGPEIIQPPGWPVPQGYANAVAASGRQLFLAGQVGWDPRTGAFASDDLAAQAAQALANIAAVLQAAGAEPRHLTRLTWYVTDRAEYLAARPAIGAAYRALIGRHYPAMSLLVVHSLLEERAKVEIEATAVIPSYPAPMSVHSIPRLTADEYLALERTAEIKSEFLDGQMIAMTGGSIRHGRIASNLVQAIGLQLRGRSCEVFGSDVRVLVAQTGLYAYPDVTIVCGELTLTDEHLDTLTNPTVLIEVLSPSTAAYDRTTKFEHYRALAALREYLLVSQDQPKVERYVRQENRKDWLFTEITDLAGSIVLPSIECALNMAEIYARVRFDDPPETTGLT